PAARPRPRARLARLRARDEPLDAPALAPREDRGRRLRLPDRRGRDRPAAQAARADGADPAAPLPRHVRLGEPAPRADRRRDAPDPARRAPRRAHERAAAGPLRQRLRGDCMSAGPGTPLLELDRVSKAFGGLRVIENLDLVVSEHEIVSVIGPNG